MTTTDALGAVHTFTYARVGRRNLPASISGSQCPTCRESAATTYDVNGYVASRRDYNGNLVCYANEAIRGLELVRVEGFAPSVVSCTASLSTYTPASVSLDGSPSTTILNNVTYDPFGPITGWTWGNGTASASRTFDTDGKVTAISSTATAVGNRTFGYDDAFRITSTTDSLSSALNWTLGYDLLDRLNSASKTATTIGYTYDANGNRLSQTGTTASTYTVSGASNKLSSTTGGLVRTYTYNASGSVLTSGVATHTYYNSGRMKTGKLGSAGATTYVYNALGQRIKKSGGAISTAVYFMYDEAGHLVGEYNVSGSTVTPVQETVWVGDIPVATIRGTLAAPTIFYVHTDQLNTPRKVTNTANQLRWKWDPSPFGDGGGLSENPASLGTFKYHLRFPGQYFDLETNLNYNYFRDYESATGRYAQSDPIGFGGGINTFSYALSNPVSQGDPFGLDVTITISNRTYSPTGNSISGSIHVSSTLTPIPSYTGHTLENSNAGPNHDRRPIPGGSYNAFIRRDRTPNRIELQNVRGYLNIQIHPGNVPGNFEGCFGPGNTAAIDNIGGSVAALNAILDIIGADGSGNIRVNVSPAPLPHNRPNPATRPGPVQLPANPFYTRF